MADIEVGGERPYIFLKNSFIKIFEVIMNQMFLLAIVIYILTT